MTASSALPAVPTPEPVAAVPAPAQPPVQLNWIDQQASFNFRIGDIQVGRLVVPARTPTNYFWELEKGIDLDTLQPGERAIVLRSMPVKEAPARTMRRPGVLQYVPRSYKRFLTDLRITPEQYLAGMSGKSRNTLKRKVRKFEEEHGSPIDFRAYRKEEEIPGYLEAARAVSRTTYQEKLLDFGLPDDDAFVRNLQETARRGDWRGYVLHAKGKPIAYVHCPIVRGIAIYAYVGFDPHYSSASPGTVLQWLILQDMFPDDHIQWFDYTEGEGPHKEFFSTHNWLCADIWLFEPTLANRLRVFAHATLDSFGVKTGQLLERFGLKRRFKRLLRGQ